MPQHCPVQKSHLFIQWLQAALITHRKRKPSSKKKEKIKVGLLIDSFFVPAWIHETVKRITESNYAFVAVVVKREAGAPSFKGFNYLAYNLYGKLSRKYTKVRPKAFLKKNSIGLFKD